MELLDKKDYEKAIEPIRQVTINNLFARAVAEQKVTGKIFVDDVKDPTTFYVVHPYGMTLLLGNSNNQVFNEAFKRYALNIDKTRTGHEWMQAFPGDWDITLSNLFSGALIKSADNITEPDKGIVELNTRINFTFNEEKYLRQRKAMTDPAITIRKADRQLFRDMQGSVVPAHFWDTEDDFFKNGLAYALFYKGELAAMSFSSFWFDNLFELGIETKEKFRGKGLAELVCTAIIDYCLENKYEPIWACRLENTGSYKLAQKLGFEPAIEIPYYRLSS